jgi:hypothetical protein
MPSYDATKEKARPRQVLSKEADERLKYIFDRLDRARRQREEKYDEFDGMDLKEWVEWNAKTANAYVAPKKNASDTQVVLGTAREKMLSIISNVVKMNLDVDFLAFDKHDNEDNDVARAFTDIVKKSNELEGDAMKKILRWLYLLEQGTIFVEEAYVPYTQKRKRPKDGGKFDPATGAESIEMVEEYLTNYQCERNIIDLLGVFLGDIRQPELAKQPYLATRQVMHYDEFMAVYGRWKEAKFVCPGHRKQEEEDSVPYRDYRMMSDLKDYEVEVIKYQDWWEDEYQIIANGVAMLPVNFWIPWEFEAEGVQGAKTSNLTKCVYEPYQFFAYGKSLMAKVRFDNELLDEILRMLVSKTRQSIKPPTANRTNKVLSPRIFDAGTMWEGIDPTKLAPLINHQGVNQSEFNMYKELQAIIDRKTVSPVFQGQQTQGSTTATEILEMQRQARLALGLALFSIQWLEERVAWLRLQNVLNNWMKPVDTEFDEAREVIVNKYRKFAVGNVDVGGRTGTHYIEMTDGVPSQEERLDMSFAMYDEEKKQGRAVKRTILSVPLLHYLRYRFQARCNPQERPSDNANKVLFNDELNQALTYFGPAVNIDFYKKKFAQIWGNDPNEMFTSQNMQALDQALQDIQAQKTGEPLQIMPPQAPANAQRMPQIGGTGKQTPRPNQQAQRMANYAGVNG